MGAYSHFESLLLAKDAAIAGASLCAMGNYLCTLLSPAAIRRTRDGKTAAEVDERCEQIAATIWEFWRLTVTMDESLRGGPVMATLSKVRNFEPVRYGDRGGSSFLHVAADEAAGCCSLLDASWADWWELEAPESSAFDALRAPIEAAYRPAEFCDRFAKHFLAVPFDWLGLLREVEAESLSIEAAILDDTASPDLGVAMEGADVAFPAPAANILMVVRESRPSTLTHRAIESKLDELANKEAKGSPITSNWPHHVERLSERMIAEYVRKLEDSGYLTRPDGPTKGVTITEKGLAAMNPAK